MQTIDDIVNQYDRGLLTRRQLVQGLLLVAAPSVLQAPRTGPALRARSLDHVAIDVSDMARSRDFYEKLFGNVMPSRPDGTQLQLPLGMRSHLNLNADGGKVGLDHFAVAVEGFTVEGAMANVKRALPATKIETAADSISLIDPDGVRIQIEPVR
jgi:catechol 2,3-dioxygenase-like lactoylglutathione lyase family enzyme